MKLKRTHLSLGVGTELVGQTVVLSGWVNSCRNLGGLVFIDLRDRTGITQLVINPTETPELVPTAQQLREEWVITARGTVQPRPESMVNTEMATGAIEVQLAELQVENGSAPMPYHLDDPAVSDDLRLKYRYLDLRRSGIGANLRLRHKVAKLIRDYLDQQEFVEVETPILSKSTPEGARDYLIPSRVHPGKFFALPQAPQQYKQLLMVGGLERYFQIARCFRDEDLRADRQPEFTQVDIEMSFVEREDLLELIEGMLAKVMLEVKGVDLPRPFPRMSHAEAMARYGSDKPDTRFGMELTDLGHLFGETEFRVFQSVLEAGGVIKAINAKGMSGQSRKQIDAWTDLVKGFGAKGLAWMKVAEDGACTGPLSKPLSDTERTAMLEALDAEAGDLLMVVADKAHVANNALGRLRLDVAEIGEMIPADRDEFLWVVDFPLLDWDEDEKRYVAVHHPFTSPLDEDRDLLESDPGAVRAKAYDVIWNGVELGGGSIRIHQADLQSKMFDALGIDSETAQYRFGHLLKALSFGAPPHGGIALGFDRFIMLLAGAASIREVIAFPKTTKAACLMTDSPSTVDDPQLEDLHIRTVAPAEGTP
jgi:aspartyl-tRNA synthetase